MLGDNPEKSKNPLKNAMRRRYAKTVQFAEPTYFEPSDNEYSSDEEGDEGEYSQVVDSSQTQGQEDVSAHSDGVAIEPLHVRGSQMNATNYDEIETDPRSQQSEPNQEPQIDKPRSSEDILDHPGRL